MAKAKRMMRVKIDGFSSPQARIDVNRVDATTEEEIEAQIIEDQKEADAEIAKNKLKNQTRNS